MSTRTLFTAAIAVCFASELHAATLTVTNTNDAGTGSLRQAIASAASGDTITFSLPAGSAITLTSGQLFIDKNLSITGPGAHLLTVRTNPPSGSQGFRVFLVNAGRTVTISGLTITNGGKLTDADQPGGGILNHGNLTVSNAAVVRNAGPFGGGGIYNTPGAATLTVINSTVSDNTTQGRGGGIANQSGTTHIINSTISGNRGIGGAGGVRNSFGTVTVTNSTITVNSTSGGSVMGGGISQDTSTFVLRNTIVALNLSPIGPDASGSFTSQGHNLIGNNSGATFSAATGDQIGTPTAPIDPKLGPLQDNGGPTFTHALLSGSPAIEAGHSGGVTTDQRGGARPVDSPTIANASGGDGADIGAYEVQADILPGCNNVDRVVRNAADSGAGSLRGVIASVCAGSTITFAPEVRGAIELTTAQLIINKSVNIEGPGANLLSIQRSSASGTPEFRILEIGTNFNVAISGLTISGGKLGGEFSLGGGVSNLGRLTLTGVAISGNSAAFGGGISTNRAGAMTLSRSTVSGNSATGGGGITGAAFSVIDSTISGNSAAAGGGMLVGTGAVALTNTTISGNSASQDGGGVFNDKSSPASIRTRNTLIAGNSAANGPDVSGALTSENFNLIGNNSGATITPATQFADQIGTPGSPIDPQLGPLQDNGGTTLTRSLLEGSPAIDKGHSSGSTTDQRGLTRAVDRADTPNAADGDGGDIGAFEVQLPTPTPTPTATPQPNRFANISTRLRVETGDNVLIGGFIVTGSMQKRIIVRALGPSLPLDDRLANPLLELYDSNAQLIDANDNWEEAPNRQEIIDSTIPPSNSLESAILRNVDLGAYTAIVRGADGGEGVGLVEIYDLGNAQDSKLANISTRGRVLTGDNVMIGGVIITGSSPQKVIVRAIGPSLPVPGKLDDPFLELFDGDGNRIAANDDWKDTQQADIEATTIPPSNDLESAIVTFLPPAAYTAVVRGVNDAIGVALVEAYALD